MNPTQFDSGILQKFADDLYARARWIIFSTAAMHGAVVFILSYIGVLVANHMTVQAQEWGVIGTLTLVAAAIRREPWTRKSASVETQAQQILCQRRIEENTRAASAGTKAFSANV
jgi:hypothetical protein